MMASKRSRSDTDRNAKRSRSDTDRNAISCDAEDDIERSSACKKKQVLL